MATRTAPAVAMACPHCGSGDTARMQAVWEHGTRDYISDNPDFGVTIGGSATVAAQRAAPPRRQVGGGMSIAIGGAMTLFWFVVIAASFGGHRERHRPGDPPQAHSWQARAAVAVAGLLFLVAPFPALLAWGVARNLRVRRWNKEQLPGLYAAWQRQWTCRRCGNVWTP